MIRRLVLVVALSLSLHSAARGETPRREPSPVKLQTPTCLAGTVQRSPAVAVWSSILTTVGLSAVGLVTAFPADQEEIGLVVTGLGASFGPAVGSFYARSVATGIGVSLLRGLLYGLGVGLIYAGKDGEIDPKDGTNDGGLLVSLGVTSLVGVLVFAALEVYLTAKDIRRANTCASRYTLTLAPLIGPSPGGTSHVGLALGGRF